MRRRRVPEVSGKFCAGIDSLEFVEVFVEERFNSRPGLPLDGHDVGEVVLTLGVPVGYLVERGEHGRDLEAVQARIDLGDRTLFRCCLSFFDDRLNATLHAPEDPTIAIGVVGPRGQERSRSATPPVVLDQLPQSIGLDLRSVAIQHQEIARHAFQEFPRDHDGMTGAALFGLQNETRPSPLQGGADEVRVMTDDDDYCIGLKSCGGFVDEMQHRDATDGMEDLGAVAHHARALAGSHDEDVDVLHTEAEICRTLWSARDACHML